MIESVMGSGAGVQPTPTTSGLSGARQAGPAEQADEAAPDAVRTSPQQGDDASAAQSEFEQELSTAMGATEQSEVQNRVGEINAELREQRNVSNELGRDDFLRILITQLRHQDPTDPMDDKEFVAQMAQFSSLEQMTNLASDFTELAGVLRAGQAENVLGRTVQLSVADESVRGRVEAVTRGEHPQVRVDGQYYDYNDITSVEE